MVNRGKQHLKQARHNEAVAKWLSYTPFTDWAVVALFYSALHLVDSYLVGVRQVVSSTHEQRVTNMEREQSISLGASDRFRVLWKASEDARYSMKQFSRAEFEQLSRTYYQQLKDELSNLNRKAQLEQRTELGGRNGGLLR